jgi:hypothetical protein
MGIALGADVFEDAEELALLQDVLAMTERRYGWPTTAV